MGQNYYVWCDEHCDNSTEDLAEAKRWCDEFLAEGRDAYVVDADNRVVYGPED